MSFTAFLSFMGIGTLIAWIGWGIVLFGIDPVESGLGGLVIFYVTLSVALVGTVTIIGSLFRVTLMKRGVPTREIRTAFRHAVLFSVVAVLSLTLSASGSFHPWHAFLFLAVASLIEYVFLQFHRRSH